MYPGKQCFYGRVDDLRVSGVRAFLPLEGVEALNVARPVDVFDGSKTLSGTKEQCVSSGTFPRDH